MSLEILVAMIFVSLSISHLVVYRLGVKSGETKIKSEVWRKEIIARQMEFLRRSLFYVSSDEDKNEIKNIYKKLIANYDEANNQ